MRPAEDEEREADIRHFRPPDPDIVLRVCESVTAGCCRPVDLQRGCGSRPSRWAFAGLDLRYDKAAPGPDPEFSITRAGRHNP